MAQRMVAVVAASTAAEGDAAARYVDIVLGTGTPRSRAAAQA